VRIGTTIRFGASGGPAGSAPGAAEPPFAEGDEDGDAEPDGVLGGAELGAAVSDAGGALTCPTGGGLAVVSGRASQNPIPIAAPTSTTPPTIARIRFRREPKGPPSPPDCGG
jgi:hypothetical protein